MQQEGTEALLQSLRWLQTSSEYSDLKVFCGDQVFLIHKAIACPRSAFFATACRWSNESHTKGEIDLGEDDPKLVKLIIDYLYQLDYNDILPPEILSNTEGLLPKEPDSPVARTVKFFESMTSNGTPALETAETTETSDLQIPWNYGLTPKEKRRKEKQMRLDGIWESRLTQEMIDEDAVEPVSGPRQEVVANVLDQWSASIEKASSDEKLLLQDSVQQSTTERLPVNAGLYGLADKYGMEALKTLARTKFSEAARQDWKSEAFVRAADLAFSNTPSSDVGLRNVVLDTLHQHQELTNYQEVQDLLNSGNGIAWLLVKLLISRPGF